MWFVFCSGRHENLKEQTATKWDNLKIKQNSLQIKNLKLKNKHDALLEVPNLWFLQSHRANILVLLQRNSYRLSAALFLNALKLGNSNCRKRKDNKKAQICKKGSNLLKLVLLFFRIPLMSLKSSTFLQMIVKIKILIICSLPLILKKENKGLHYLSWCLFYLRPWCTFTLCFF